MFDLTWATHDISQGEQDLVLWVWNDSLRPTRLRLQCQIIDQRNPWWDKTKSAMRHPFDLAWVGVDRLPLPDRSVVVQPGHNVAAVLARLRPYDGKILTMAMTARGDNGSEFNFTTDRIDGDPPLEWDLLVTVFKKGWFREREVLRKAFVLRGRREGKNGLSLNGIIKTVG